MSALRPCPHCGHVDLSGSPELAAVLAAVRTVPRPKSTRDVADVTGKSVQNAGLLLKKLAALSLVRSQPRAQPSGGYENVWVPEPYSVAPHHPL